jgi:MFS family permease
MMRNLLSMAITQIAKRTISDDQVILGEVCQASSSNDSILSDDNENSRTGTYEWSEFTQGVILSSFYWGRLRIIVMAIKLLINLISGYIVTHIPGGMVVEKLGGKIMLLGGIAATSVLTILTPASITYGGSTLLIINRVIMGLCQGFIYASVFGILAVWIPLRERTTLGVFVLSGIQVGSILSTYLSGVLLQNIDGWDWPFYIYSVIGVLWCFAFVSFD